MAQNKDASDWMDLLEEITEQSRRSGGISLDKLLRSFGDKAFGLPLLILALPCAVPFLYAVPQIVSIPIILLSVQFLMLRPSPWLPEKFLGRAIANREMSTTMLEGSTKFAKKWFGWTRKISRPNLLVLTSRAFQPILGFFMTGFGLSISIPLPSTNTLPGIALAIVSIGILNRDGRLVLLGLILGTAWIAFLISALVFSAGFLAEKFGN